jgi:hypothetical protein
MKTPITQLVITPNLVQQIAAALKVNISGMNVEEFQTGMIQELGNMLTYTIEALDHKKLVKAFQLAHNNISVQQNFYTSPKDEIGHPLKGTQGTQFDTTGLVEEIIKEELEGALSERKKQFDFNTFNTLSSLGPQEQLTWLIGNAKMVGKGSGRATFILDSSKVLKFALNKQGRLQNTNEINIYQNTDQSGIVPRIYDYDSANQQWLIVELVKPLRGRDEFIDKVGMSPYHFAILSAGEVDLNTILDVKPNALHDEKKLEKNLSRFGSFFKDHKIETGDLASANQWGINTNGNIILLDYGLSESYFDSQPLEEGKKFFDLNKFKKLSDVNDQFLWLHTTGGKVGSGLGRSVFLADSSKVIKFARNDFGVKQNKLEALKSKKDTVGFLPKIIDHAKDYRWLISELVRPVKSEKELSQYTGFSDSYYLAILVEEEDMDFDYFAEEYGDSSIIDKNKAQNIVEKIKKFREQTGINVYDLGSYTQWGVNTNGELVILDYGMGDQEEHSSLVDENVLNERKKHLDMKSFLQLPNSVNARLKWLLANGNKLGKTGSGRATFLIDSSKVLKLAVNNKGVAQNELEEKISNDPDVNSIVTRVFKSAPDHSWIVSQVVRELNSDREFEKETGGSLKDVMNYLNVLNDHPHLRKDPNTPAFILSLEKLIKKYKMQIPDIDMPGHWGKTPDGRIVLLDYGFNEEVFKKHYALGQDRPTLAPDQPTNKVAESFDLFLERKKQIDFKAFKELPDNVDARMNWLKQNAEHAYLGEGSSRMVFLIDTSKVLKIAMNAKGYAQNEEEVLIYTDPKAKPIIAKIFDASEDYGWIVSEIVRPLKSEEEFKNYFGLTSLSLDNVYHHTHFPENYSSNSNEMIKNMLNQANKEIIMTLFEFMKNHELLIGDVARYEHWGKTADGRVVLLDYGFSEHVADEYYNT